MVLWWDSCLPCGIDIPHSLEHNLPHLGVALATSSFVQRSPWYD